MFTSDNSETPPARPKYDFLPFARQGLLGANSTKLIEETAYIKLNQAIDENIKNKDFDNAILNAKKMAIHYGVPGILRYVDACEELMKQQIDEGEEIQTFGFNTLIYLFIAKKLYEHDQEAKDCADQTLPNANLHSNQSWQNMMDRLVKLAGLSALIEEADLAASDVLNALYVKSKPTSLK